MKHAVMQWSVGVVVALAGLVAAQQAPPAAPGTNVSASASTVRYRVNYRPMAADPWQIDVLDGKHRRLLLNCCRQSGKSTAVAMLALLEACFLSDSLILLLSPSLRQSSELLRKVDRFHVMLGSPLRGKRTPGANSSSCSATASTHRAGCRPIACWTSRSAPTRSPTRWRFDRRRSRSYYVT